MRGRENSGTRRRRSSGPPWLWTIAVSASLASMVGVGGSLLSRQTETFSERPAGNRSDDAFREMARAIDRMEGLWEKALDDEANRLLTNSFKPPPADTVIVGVVQRSLLNRSFHDPARHHLRTNGGPPEWRPVLESFGRKVPGEWVLGQSDVLNGAGWIEMPDRPPAWWRGNGGSAVVLLVDPAEAAKVTVEELRASFNPDALSGEAGASVWTGPGGEAWMKTGELNPSARPDEILRHVSRFGDWTLERFYPVRVETTCRMPVLAGSLAVAALLLGGGILVALWQRKAIRAAEERVSFVNRVSHELRTPLTNLLLNTDLALDSLPTEDLKQRRRLGLIREETGRLSRIVDNVLAFARVESGNTDVRGAACDTGRLLDELKENFAPLFERKSIICKYDHSLLGEIPLDRDAFSQILSNLLSNIEKYAGEGSTARVSLSRRNGGLVAEVEDNGPGIPAEARKRIFMPFERAESRVDEGASGTGLGLAISRELAERMGGRLELVPAVAGAKFRLLVPLPERSPA